MTLAGRVTAAIALSLLAVIILGTVLSFWQGVRRIEVETRAAMAHARGAIAATLAAKPNAADAYVEIHRLLRSFDESRHIRAFLISRGGVTEASRPNVPEEAPPAWLVSTISPRADSEVFDLSSGFAPAVVFRLQTEPLGEMGEIWEEIKLDFGLLAALAAIVLAAARLTVTRALEPLGRVVESIEQIGGGDYSPRVPVGGTSELRRIGDACNAMAQRLADTDRDNRRLNEELISVQEQERADLARDLHDGMGPLLFGIDVDAMGIEENAEELGDGGIGRRARAIRGAAGAMKDHLSALLAKLRPEVTMDLGLGHAVGQLAAACRERHPRTLIETSVPTKGWNKEIDGAIYYIIREGLNNALRHSGAGRIAIAATESADGTIRVSIEDDGRGLSSASGRAGYGILGMRERAAALGGELDVSSNGGARGAGVRASIPAPASSRASPNTANRSVAP